MWINYTRLWIISEVNLAPFYFDGSTTKSYLQFFTPGPTSKSNVAKGFYLLRLSQIMEVYVKRMQKSIG